MMNDDTNSYFALHKKRQHINKKKICAIKIFLVAVQIVSKLVFIMSIISENCLLWQNSDTHTQANSQMQARNFGVFKLFHIFKNAR